MNMEYVRNVSYFELEIETNQKITFRRKTYTNILYEKLLHV